MKIISLESVGLGDSVQDGTTGDLATTQRYFKVGSCYHYNPFGKDSDRDPKILSISLEFSFPDNCPVDEGCYYVRTDDGHVFILPLNAYIAEWSD